MGDSKIDSTTCATSPTTKTAAGCEPDTCRAISPASRTSPSPSFASRGASTPSPKPTGTTLGGPRTPCASSSTRPNAEPHATATPRRLAPPPRQRSRSPGRAIRASGLLCIPLQTTQIPSSVTSPSSHSTGYRTTTTDSNQSRAHPCTEQNFTLDLDRVMDREGVSPVLRRLVVENRLLMQRGDRISFPHEMFFDAFAAEAVVRQAKDQPEAILESLATPLHAERKDLVIGAIDDDSMLEGLLPRLEDSGSVTACLQGRCGSRALEWAERYCRELWSRLREESRGACFSTGSRGWEGVEFDENSLTTWSPCDRAYMGLLPALVAEGRYLEEAIEVIGILDQRIAEEWIRLRYDTRINDTKLRNGLFAISFAIPAISPCAPAISRICAGIGNAVGIARKDCFRLPKDPVPTEKHRVLLERDLSQGQLYFLLQRSRGGEIPASFLARTIESRWESAPYHLQIALLHSAAVNSKGDAADRAKLIKAVEELGHGRDLYVSDSILETLQMLGALDDDAQEHRDVVRENVRECLARSADRDSHVRAWIIYCSQFEHPYSAAYCEVVSELGNGDRKLLLEMAAEGVRDSSFWLTPLLIDLASIGGRSSGGSIARWTRVPEAESRAMPQEDIAVFVVAHIALARFGCQLPDTKMAAGGSSAEVLAACGVILYWINRSDLGEDERLTACGDALDVLEDQAKGFGARCCLRM